MKRDFYTSGTTLIRYRGHDECVEIPEGITVIYENAFRDLKNIKCVNLPSTIKTIIRCHPGKTELFKKMPEWKFNKIGRLSAEIAELTESNWLSQMTPHFWAVLYLTQNSPAFKDLFEKHMADKPNEYLSEMITLLEESDKTDMFTRAAGYAAEYNKELKAELIGELNALVIPNKRAKSAGEILNSLINPKETPKSSPYAWLYEKFDEPKLLKRYRDFGGKVKGLGEALSPDKDEFVPAIAVLAAVVPYLEFFDKKFKFGNRNDKIKILPYSDKAAETIDRASLIDFINENTDIKSNSRWMYPYCRYASEQEIKELISSRKKAARKQSRHYEEVLPANALLLSDHFAARLELYELAEQTNSDLGSLPDQYAKIRGTRFDAAITDIGLDENGEITFDLEDKKITACLTDNFRLKLKDETGESLGSLPKKGMDSALRREAKAGLKEINERLKKAVKIRTKSLLKDFLSGKGVSFEEWKHTNFATAVNKKFAEKLVWEQDGKTFTVKDGRMIISSGREFAPSDSAVRLAHPMEMNKEDVSTWRNYFKSKKIYQPFAQAAEPASDWESLKEKRYVGLKIPLSRFTNKKEHGIDCVLFLHYPTVKLKDCNIQYTVYNYDRKTYADAEIEVYKFVPLKKNRQANHIIALLDEWTLEERIKKDDMSALEFTKDASASQLEEYTKIAIDSGAKNLTAKFLEMKKERFPEFGALDEFTLGEW